MTKVTSGCTLASFLRRRLAVEADFADADEAADDADMHDAAQHAAVPANRTDDDRQSPRRSKDGLGRRKADLLDQADAARIAAQKMAMRLAEAEAAAAEPVESALARGTTSSTQASGAKAIGRRP